MQVGGQIAHVVMRERLGLCTHDRVAASVRAIAAALVSHQRMLQVILVLASQLRIARIDRALEISAMAGGAIVFLSWSLRLPAMPRMLGCLRSPFWYAFSAFSMYLADWPPSIGT
jgi:hypothetical protein